MGCLVNEARKEVYPLTKRSCSALHIHPDKLPLWQYKFKMISQETNRKPSNEVDHELRRHHCTYPQYTNSIDYLQFSIQFHLSPAQQFFYPSLWDRGPPGRNSNAVWSGLSGILDRIERTACLRPDTRSSYTCERNPDFQGNLADFLPGSGVARRGRYDGYNPGRTLPWMTGMIPVIALGRETETFALENTHERDENSSFVHAILV